MNSQKNQSGARVGYKYMKPCFFKETGKVCKPVEGSFVTECEVKNCKNFE